MALVSPRSIGTRSGVALAATLGAIAASGVLSSGAHAQSAACWGRNLEGQCNPPTNLGSIQSISGGLYHTIALRTNGSVVCWGSSGEGQTAIPAGLGPASAIASGHLHNLALLSNGTVVAWGRNLEGQSTVPAGLAGVTAVSAGWKHSVALKGDGSVVAWGSNTVGQLNVPATLGVARRIAAGGQHTLALRSNGTVVGWGAGTSSTGANPHFGQSVPPADLAGVTAIAGGTLHSAAVRADGTVACWGLNSSGQCTVPAGLAGVASVVAGNAHTVALRTDGSIVGWGSGTSGQLTPPAGLGPASVLFAGGQHSGGIVATAPTVAVVSTTPSTCSLANGAIDVTVTGATATAWSGPNGFASSSVDLAGLAAGSYTLTATGPGGTATTTVAVPGTADTTAPTITQFVPTVTRDADTSCNGAAFDFASTVVASDDCTAAGALAITQTPVAGAILGLGTHAVTITVRDAAGNATTAQATFTVTGTPRPFCTDFDQDGFGDPATIAAFCQEPQGGVANDGDCNDRNNHINPMASEECDGEDNDCDHFIDEDQPQFTYYRDADGDGFGKSSEDIQSCSPTAPPGYAAVGGDCNDFRADVYPGAVENCANDGVDNDCDGQAYSDAEAVDAVSYYSDADQDGYGAGSAIRSCTPVAGRVPDNTDCNDADATISPGDPEICDPENDDEDCDTLRDDADPSALDATRTNFYRDVDADGFGAGAASRSCDLPAGFSASDRDCNDGDPSINPNGQEICDPENDDEDCDTLRDNADGSALGSTKTDFYADGDNDSYGAGPAVRFCDIAPGYSANDDDCNDADSLIYPGAAERCNGVSDDCDAEIDEGLAFADYYADADHDGFGDESGSPVSSCKPVDGRVPNNADCNDANPSINPNGQEVCDLGNIDEDCDDAADNADSSALESTKSSFYVDADGDGQGAGAAVRFCDITPGYSPNANDCNDADALIYSGAAERCNGVSDDCDGEIDEGLAFTDYYIDADLDGFGDESGSPLSSCKPVDGRVPNNADCNDANPSINPNGQEVCDLGNIDEDCDGAADNDDSSALESTKSNFYVDADGDGQGAGAAVRFCDIKPGHSQNANDCNDLDKLIFLGAPERCNNADDDCDGGIDDDLVFITYYADADSDQFGDETDAGVAACAPIAGKVMDNTDCDDGDATVNPNGQEICDPGNVDEDCDDLADDGDGSALATTKVDFYIDADRDGFGDEFDAPRNACDPLAGEVTDNRDCDDARPAINPNGTEACDADNRDEDCDDLADDLDVQGAAGKVDFYVDADHDGFGDELGAPRSACDPLAGEVTDNGDCDDARADINPNGTETCDAGNRDEDCDGAADDLDTGGAIGKVDFYVDADHDAFGDQLDAPRNACDPLSGEVANNTDCDDANAKVNPAQAESCNDIDDDCDLAIDEDVVYKTYFLDADGDTFGDENDPGASDCKQPAGRVLNSTDCDDGDATINPNGQEICDPENDDEDCDGTADNADSSALESTKSGFFLDADHDGYGAGTAVPFCDLPAGYSTSSTDCDDADPSRSPGRPEQCDAANLDEDCDDLADDLDPQGASGKVDFYADADNDEHGVAPAIEQYCDDAAGRSLVFDDCDDANADRFPGNPERCDAGDIDQDCDGFADDLDPQGASGKVDFFVDADGDNFGTTAFAGQFCDDGAGRSPNDDDCDDANADRFPGNPERCDAGDIDQDCDGFADDLDPQGASGKTDFFVDLDGDEFGSTAVAGQFCDDAAGRSANDDDCNDDDDAINPEAQEICDAANTDEDCDTLADNDDASALESSKSDFYIDADHDGFGAEDAVAERFCDLKNGYSPTNDDCLDTDPTANPDGIEDCANDGVDNDCDGEANDDAEAIDSIPYFLDGDGDGFGKSDDRGVLSCTAIAGRVLNHDDCDDTLFLYADGDTDGFGAGAPANCGVPTNDDCDDANAAVYPGAPETCSDLQVDNDCDRSTSEDEAIDRTEFCFDADADGFGSDSDPKKPSVLACSAPTGYVANCTDGCASDPAKQAPGVCGCGNPDADDNGNGAADCLDFVFSLTPDTEALGPGDGLTVELASTFPFGASATAPSRAIGFQAVVAFDPAHFELVAIDPILDGPFPLELGESIDNATGRAIYSAGVLNFGDPAAGMTTDAPLARLHFRAKAALPDCTELGLIEVLRDTGASPLVRTLVTTESSGALIPRIPVATPIVALRIDAEAPALSGIPGSVTLAMDAGSDFGARVDAPTVSILDNCEPEPALSLLVSYPDGTTADAWPADGMFPRGTTTIRWTGDDGAGNIAEEIRTITVQDHYLLDIRLQFNSCIESATTRAIRISGLPGGDLLREATFEPWIGSTPGVSVIPDLEVDWTLLPACIEAKDVAAVIGATTHFPHSISAVDPELAIVGRKYVAAFTLLQGDSDDNNRIDIIDYGLFASDRGAGRAANARSNFNGDSDVDNADFGVFVVNFFLSGQTCGTGKLAGEPVSRISLKELRRRGLGHLAAADLNGDLWLDLTDVQLFVEGRTNGSLTGTERMP